MLEDLKKTLPNFLITKKKSGIHFDLPRLKETIRSYDIQMSDPSFGMTPKKPEQYRKKPRKQRMHMKRIQNCLNEQNPYKSY